MGRDTEKLRVLANNTLGSSVENIPNPNALPALQRLYKRSQEILDKF